MSIEVIGATDGILTVKISGTLTCPEHVALQRSAAEYIEKYGQVSLLVLAEGFQGWEKASNWGDISFSDRYDPFIKCMAIVCEREWEELVLVFTQKGFRKFPIRYFQPDELDRARAWVAAP